MDINKALQMSKNLQNHFRIFAELDEFMREAVALQNVVKEFETLKAGLQADITTLEREKVAFSKSLAELKQRKKDEFERMSADLDEKISTRTSEIEADLSNDVSKAEARKKKAKDEADEMEKLHAETRQRIEQETMAAEATLKAVEKKIRDIRVKLE